MKKLNNNVTSAISSLEWAISRNNYSERSEDEFTSADFAEALGVSNDYAARILLGMVKKKLLVSRKMAINGKSTNLYKKC